MSKENTNPSQCFRLAMYLGTHSSITQIEALQELGILRLASRISELKKEGIPIESKFVKGINRFGENYRVKAYWIAKEGENA